MNLDDLSNFQSLALAWATRYGLRIVSAIIVLLIGLFIASRLRRLFEAVLRRGHLDKALVGFLSQALYYVMLVLILIMVAGQAGVQTASLLAVLGTAGLAVGLALKDYLSNFAAGVMLFITRPFHIEEWVEVGGVTGKVSDITMFQTTLTTGDNRKVLLPNSKVMNDRITNITAHDRRRLDLIIGVSYDDDIDKVKEVLQRIVSQEALVLAEPAPLIAVFEFADSSVNFAVRPWVNTSDYWPARYALLEEIKRTFDEEEITIPFPQRDLHLYNVPNAPSTT